MKTSIINGSEVSRLSVAIQFLATAVEAPPTNNVVKIIILTNADLRI